MDDLLAAIRRINGQLAARRPIADYDKRILATVAKVTEEAGELAAAVTGMLGLNPRKGYTHSHLDVAHEAIDVAIVALILADDVLVRAGDDLEQVLGDRLAFLAERARKSGAPDVEELTYAAR